MEFIIIWFLLAGLVGYVALKKGRSEVTYFFLSLFLSPLIGFLILLAAGDDEEGTLQRGELKKCLYCAELIKIEAIKCKHCGADLNSEIKLKTERSITSEDIAKLRRKK
jgi:hypothetical protein